MLPCCIHPQILKQMELPVLLITIVSTFGRHFMLHLYFINSPPSDIDWDLFTLPARLGRLGIHNYTRQCELEFSASQAIPGPLKEEILYQKYECPFKCVFWGPVFSQAVQSADNISPPAGKNLASEWGDIIDQAASLAFVYTK